MIVEGGNTLVESGNTLDEWWEGTEEYVDTAIGCEDRNVECVAIADEP